MMHALVAAADTAWSPPTCAAGAVAGAVVGVASPAIAAATANSAAIAGRAGRRMQAGTWAAMIVGTQCGVRWLAWSDVVQGILRVSIYCCYKPLLSGLLLLGRIAPRTTGKWR